MRLPKFEYFAPKTLEAALSLLTEQGEGAHVMAGGTDVMVKMTHGRLEAQGDHRASGDRRAEWDSFCIQQKA